MRLVALAIATTRMSQRGYSHFFYVINQKKYALLATNLRYSTSKQIETDKNNWSTSFKNNLYA